MLTSDTTGQACFTVDVMDDMFIESEESFTLVLVPDDIEIDIEGVNTTFVVQDNDCESGESHSMGGDT